MNKLKIATEDTADWVKWKWSYRRLTSLSQFNGLKEMCVYVRVCVCVLC